MASTDSNSSPESNIYGAFGAVLGYIGAEAATQLTFERLLWPQRFYSNFHIGLLPHLSLLLPMGGPLHKAALKTLDVAFSHGLFKGLNQGHMLGTAFLRSLSWTYTMHGGEGHESHTDVLRNCLWSRVLSAVPAPKLASSLPGVEKGNDSQPPLRAQVAVHHLTLSRATAQDKASSMTFIGERVGAPGIRILLAIVATELSAVLVALGLAAGYRTWWALLWLAPLALRLLSAVCALRREPLISLSSAAADDPAFDFEVHCPQSEGNFMLLTGPPTIMMQFVRHYGHPVRSRWREVLQLITVVAFGSLFPLGLLCSMVWMSAPVQLVWLCYQIFGVLAMHVARFCHSGRRPSTEARLAECLSSERDSGKEAVVLFGQERHGAGTIRVSLATTYHTRYGSGKECLNKLLQRPRSMVTDPGTPQTPPLSRSVTGVLGLGP